MDIFICRVGNNDNIKLFPEYVFDPRRSLDEGGSQFFAMGGDRSIFKLQVVGAGIVLNYQSGIGLVFETDEIIIPYGGMRKEFFHQVYVGAVGEYPYFSGGIIQPLEKLGYVDQVQGGMQDRLDFSGSIPSNEKSRR